MNNRCIMSRVSPIIVEMVSERYAEMKCNNKVEDYLEKEKLGELKIFINQKPKYCLFSFEIDSDKVYVGSETM